MTTIARKVLLPPEEVRFWFEHLKSVSENCKRSAKKAAATRKKFQMTEYHCTVCGHKFIEETEEPELWIQCDQCDLWVHWDCAGIQEEPEKFYCSSCTSQS